MDIFGVDSSKLHVLDGVGDGSLPRSFFKAKGLFFGVLAGPSLHPQVGI